MEIVPAVIVPILTKSALVSLSDRNKDKDKDEVLECLSSKGAVKSPTKK